MHPHFQLNSPKTNIISSYIVYCYMHLLRYTKVSTCIQYWNRRGYTNLVRESFEIEPIAHTISYKNSSKHRKLTRGIRIKQLKKSLHQNRLQILLAKFSFLFCYVPQSSYIPLFIMCLKVLCAIKCLTNHMELKDPFKFINPHTNLYFRKIKSRLQMVYFLYYFQRYFSTPYMIGENKFRFFGRWQYLHKAKKI